jgi:hypothetical protein
LILTLKYSTVLFFFDCVRPGSWEYIAYGVLGVMGWDWMLEYLGLETVLS